MAVIFSLVLTGCGKNTEQQDIENLKKVFVAHEVKVKDLNKKINESKTIADHVANAKSLSDEHQAFSKDLKAAKVDNEIVKEAQAGLVKAHAAMSVAIKSAAADIENKKDTTESEIAYNKAQDAIIYGELAIELLANAKGVKWVDPQ